jgi:RNA-directed DNA polymerase
MPIGNLTSQFLANVYLNELDNFIKHELKARYYIRYVDDFIILHRNKTTLENWKIEIDNFLKNALEVELHPEKTRIIPLERGITFLGFRIFNNHRLLKKSNARRIWKRLDKMKQKHSRGEITVREAACSLEGWIAYAEHANTYKLRNKVIEKFRQQFH